MLDHSNKEQPVPKSNLYVVYDRVAELIFGSIIRAGNDEVARRSFRSALGTPDGPFKGHEADYQLLHIGAINETNGSILATDANVIMDGGDWLNAQQDK